MVNVSVARRYARALLEAAGAQADEVLSQLEEVVRFLEAQPAIFSALASPALSKPQRMQVVDAVLKGSGGLSPTLGNLLKLLTERNRFEALPAISRQYRDLVDQKLGRVRGKVTSAVKLGDEQLRAIQKSLEAMTQRSVVLETSVDASLIGGATAQVGSKLFDGSLRNQLNELAQQLSQPIR